MNRTIVGNTSSDMFIIDQSTGTPPTVIQLSFITAKTLATEILGMISQMENHTGQKVLTLREIQEEMSKQVVNAAQ